MCTQLFGPTLSISYQRVDGMERAWQGDFHFRYSLISYCYSRSNIRGTEQLSGKVYADHTYISVPVKERSKKKKKGLSKNLRQVAVAIDDSGKILAVLGGKGNASSGDSEAAFASHVSPNSIVIHDEGHFGRAFSDSTEMAVNSKGKESHAMLNPVDRVCNSVQRLFKVHLRIHPENIQKYLDELVYKAEIYDDKAYSNYMHHIDISIFFSRISFRRRDIQGIQQH